MSKKYQEKKPYKIVQIAFKTQKEYESFHKDAVKKYGDNHRTDSSYIRECCRKSGRQKKGVVREKVKSLVESTQMLNELAESTNNMYINEQINKILKEQVKIWQC